MQREVVSGSSTDMAGASKHFTDDNSIDYTDTENQSTFSSTTSPPDFSAPQTPSSPIDLYFKAIL